MTGNHHLIRHGTLIVPCVLALIGVMGAILALKIEPSYDGTTGAQILPLVCSLSIVVIGILELVRRFRTSNTDTAKVSEGLPFGPARDTLALLVLVFGYIWLIGKVGYLLSTAVAAPLALWLFGIRKPTGLLLATILAPLSYHIIFFKLLGIFPPYGSWFDLLDLLEGL